MYLWITGLFVMHDGCEISASHEAPGFSQRLFGEVEIGVWVPHENGHFILSSAAKRRAFGHVLDLPAKISPIQAFHSFLFSPFSSCSVSLTLHTKLQSQQLGVVTCFSTLRTEARLVSVPCDD